MAKIIRGDGNGCVVVSKWLGMFIAFLTLTSIVWGIATSFAMKTDINPVREDVKKLQVKVERLEQNYNDQKVQFARMESKIDLLLETKKAGK